MASLMYREIVKQILDLYWERLETIAQLEALITVSLFTAMEFAESLRFAVDIYSDVESPALTKLLEGELRTNNLKFPG